MSKSDKSKCCKAPVEAVGMGDFHDDDEVCTMHNECTKCKQPCDLEYKPKEKNLMNRLIYILALILLGVLMVGVPIVISYYL